MKFLDDDNDPIFDNISPYKDDFFNNREAFGNNLIKYIDEFVEDGCVMALNAKWGEGKTTFVNWWKTDLENNNFPVVYFDAFKYDFNSEPFLAILKVLYEQFQKAKDQSALQTALKKLTENIIPAILSFSAMSLATTAFNSGDLPTSTIAVAGASSIGNFVNSFLTKNKIKSLEENIHEFKKTLSEITTALSLQSQNKKLIFIIDELDRCRPSFAVETIEKVKHLFSVSGIVWVLVMNKEQLEDSIAHIYGTKEANKYLNKFIHLTLSLPKSLPKDDGRDHYTFLTRGVFGKTHIPNDNLQKDILMEYFEPLLRSNNISIREAQRVLLLVQWVITGNNNSAEMFQLLCICLSFLKVCDPSLYTLIKNKNITVEDLQKQPFIINCNRSANFHELNFCLTFALTKSMDQSYKMIESIKSNPIAASIPHPEILYYDNKQFTLFYNKRMLFINVAHTYINEICNKLDLVS